MPLHAMEIHVDAILYRARALNATVVRETARLAKQVPDKAIWIVGYSPEIAEAARSASLPKHVIYSRRDIRALPYEAALLDLPWATMTGHHDLPVMAFFLEQPDFDRYWIIEDDVRFAGDWSTLFAALDASAADLLATTLLPQSVVPNWYWWKGLRFPMEEPPGEADLHKCFGPFARLSHRLLAAIDARYRRGWAGHFELIWPTLCRLCRFSMEDIGGNGPLVPDSRRGRYYTNDFRRWNLFPGTFIYRPAFRDADILQYGADLAGPNMLWHPVK